MKGKENDVRDQGLVTAGVASRAKEAFCWLSKGFELLTLALALPLDLGWVDSLIAQPAWVERHGDIAMKIHCGPSGQRRVRSLVSLITLVVGSF